MSQLSLSRSLQPQATEPLLGYKTLSGSALQRPKSPLPSERIAIQEPKSILFTGKLAASAVKSAALKLHKATLSKQEEVTIPKLPADANQAAKNLYSIVSLASDRIRTKDRVAAKNIIATNKESRIKENFLAACLRGYDELAEAMLNAQTNREDRGKLLKELNLQNYVQYPSVCHMLLQSKLFSTEELDNALLDAAKQGSRDTCSLLIAAGANPWCTSKTLLKETPLAMANLHKKGDVVKDLIMRGAPAIHSGTAEGKTAAIWRSEANNMFEKMVQKSDIQFVTNKLQNEQYKRLPYALVDNAKPTEQERAHKGRTLFQVAVALGQMDIVLKMLAAQNDITDGKKELIYDEGGCGVNSIGIAAHAPNPREMLDLLCSQAGGELEIYTKTKQGGTVLHYAASVGSSSAISYLLDSVDGNDVAEFVNQRDTLNRRTPIFYAAEHGCLAAGEKLTDRQARLTYIQDLDGKTPLHIAAEHLNANFCRHLLEKAPSLLLVKDNKGRTALELAVAGNDPQKVRDTCTILMPKIVDVMNKQSVIQAEELQTRLTAVNKQLLDVREGNYKRKIFDMNPILKQLKQDMENANVAKDQASNADNEEQAPLATNLLGKGGFGSVLLVTIEGKDYALKIMPLEATAERTEKQALSFAKKEIHAHRQLYHPNIVQYVCGGIDHDKKLAYIVMEKMQTSLDKLLCSDGQAFDMNSVLAILEQVAAGLYYLHTKALLVHRDLSPKNVLLNYEKVNGKVRVITAKLCDFGIAKQQDTDQNAVTTRQASDYCTRGYAPPEQFQNQSKILGLLPPVDVYAFGVLAAKMATGYEKPGTFEVCAQQHLGISEYHADLLKYLNQCCSNDDPQHRPRIGQVVLYLQKAQHVVETNKNIPRNQLPTLLPNTVSDAEIQQKLEEIETLVLLSIKTRKCAEKLSKRLLFTADPNVYRKLVSSKKHVSLAEFIGKIESLEKEKIAGKNNINLPNDIDALLSLLRPAKEMGNSNGHDGNTSKLVEEKLFIDNEKITISMCMKTLASIQYEIASRTSNGTLLKPQ